jgi:hypothetical protein
LPVWLLLRWHLRRRLAALVESVEVMAGTLRRLLWGTGARPEREGATSIRSFLESRLELTGAVATRGFSLRVLERALADAFLAHRLVRSADIQGQVLARRGEDLGVRAVRAEGAEGDNRRRREDLRNLFESRFGPSDRLLDPDQLLDYYRRQIGDTPKRELPAFLAAAGGFGAWRDEACLADSERILAHCRARFDSLATEPISDQHFFADTVGERLVRFVSRCYPNLGFGAGFKGYEGLDPDNVLVLADSSLVLHSRLESLFHQACSRAAGRAPVTETMDVRLAEVRPDAAYMMSLVQGVRVHSLRNLRRFESFHNRVDLPDDRTFPLSHEPPALGLPINPLTGYEDIGQTLTAAALETAGEERRHG